jgi:predicted Zn finger-like uncharacterized protein
VAPVTTPCPHCGAALRSSNPPPAGKRVRCPKCGEPFSVPEAEPVLEESVVEIDEDDAPPAEIDEGDDREPVRRGAREHRVQYPSSVKTAGIIWIVFGGLLLVRAVIGAVATAIVAPNHQQGLAIGIVGGCGSLLIAIFAAAFTYVGVQSIRGTARDTLGNSIGSIVFGLLNALAGVVQLAAEDTLGGAIGVICGAGLLTAAVLALSARGQYKLWRNAQNSRRRAKG